MHGRSRDEGMFVRNVQTALNLENTTLSVSQSINYARVV